MQFAIAMDNNSVSSSRGLRNNPLLARRGGVPNGFHTSELLKILSPSNGSTTIMPDTYYMIESRIANAIFELDNCKNLNITTVA